jgi:glycerol-3-phosphate dehydrogenase
VHDRNASMDGGGPRVRRPSDDPSIAAVSLHRSNPPGRVEGLYFAPAIEALAAEKRVDMPITRAVCAVLFRGTPPRAAVQELLALDPREEA